MLILREIVAEPHAESWLRGGGPMNQVGSCTLFGEKSKYLCQRQIWVGWQTFLFSLITFIQRRSVN